jgi:hypothetical protein
MSTTTTERRRHCLDCGYRVDNLPERRCPECGREFDPADPDTTSSGATGLRRWLENYRRNVGRPTRWLVPASLTICILSFVVNAIYLGDFGWAFLALAAGHLALLVGYWVRWETRQGMVVTNRLPASVMKIDAERLRRVGCAALWGALILGWRLPAKIAFVACLPALNRAVSDAQHMPPANTTMGSVAMLGPFPVRSALLGHGGADFELLTGRQLLYRPGWNSDYPGPYRHLAGRWFISDW